MTAPRCVHEFSVVGLIRPTAACTCGWVSEWHRSRGEAKRAWDAHVWLNAHNRIYSTPAQRRRQRST